MIKNKDINRHTIEVRDGQVIAKTAGGHVAYLTNLGMCMVWSINQTRTWPNPDESANFARVRLALP